MSVTHSQTHDQSALPFSEQRSDAMPFESGHLNQAFLKARMPDWFYRAPKALRMALRKSLLYSQFSRRAVEPLRSRIQPVEQFAKPLLEQALYKRFNLQLDVNAYQLVTMRYEDAAAIRRLAPFKQTLLQAALHNFEESEASPGSFQPGSALLPVDGLQLHLVEGTGSQGIAPRFRYEYQGIVPIKPEQFAELCHGLDLGCKYQAHLDDVFKPAAASGQTRDEAAQTVAMAFINSERDAVEVLAHIAMMKEHLSSAAYEMLMQLVKPNGEPRWDGHPVRYRRLHMLADQTFQGSALYGVLLIELDIPDVENGPCVVYMPGEPEHPLKEYPSLMALLVVLRRKLVSKDYQQYFRRFVSLRHSQRFFARLNERLTPLSRVEGTSALKPLYEHRLDPAANLALEAQDAGKPPFDMLYEHLRNKTCEDARWVAVPSRDEDQKQRQQRLQDFESLGLNLVNVMGFFVPVLGEVMSVLAAAQLLHETFVAVEEWRHGDLNEAVGHLFDIAENLASMAALGAATAGQPQVEASAFVESLIPVTVGNGRTRLWNPELTHFAHNIELPSWLPADTQGHIQAQGKTWLPLGGRMYRVERDTELQRWRIRHPRNAHPYSPVIEHGGAGAWHSDVENPLGWDETTAFKRLGHVEQSLSHEGMNNALSITGADEALLRQVHVHKLQSPALLKDCVQRLAIDQQIDSFVQALNSGHRYQIVTPCINPWIRLLVDAPRWPTGRRLRLVDAQGAELAHWGTSTGTTSVIEITWQPGALDTLLGKILDGLQAHERDVLLDLSNSQRTEQLQQLARYLAQRAEVERVQLLEDIHATHNNSSDSHVMLIRRDFPALPVVVAEELLSTANTVQLQRMTDAARLPLEIAEHAREYVQQLRLNRANEGFYLSATNNPDTFKAGLHLLELLPGWPADLAIELRQATPEGALIDSIGDTQNTDELQIVIKTPSGYQCAGLEGEADLSFFSALLRALPESLLTGNGLSSKASEVDLRRLLGDLAVTRREEVARILNLQAIKPGFKWPLRMPDGRVGYPLSGRLRRLFNRLGSGASSYSPELAVKSLFPSFTDEDVSAFLTKLRQEHTGTSAQLNRFLRTRLTAMAAEYRGLDTGLSMWVSAAPSLSLMRSARIVAADRIRRCWTRMGALIYSEGGEVLGYSLDLSDLAIGRLPTISARFDHVAFLTLKRLYVSSVQAEEFLSLFSNLSYLNLKRNHLLTVPSAIGRMSRLKRLWLSHNPLTLDSDSLSHLQRLHHLHFLDLSHCRLGPDLDLTGLNPLRSLLLRSTGIEHVPEWIWAWPELTDLDLRENQISDVALGILQRFARYGMRVNLHDNPLSEETLREAERFLTAYTRTRLGLTQSRQHAALLPSHAKPWFVSVGDNISPLRLQQWSDLAPVPESADFFRILRDLSMSADFIQHRGALTQRVWRMLDSVSANSELREHLFALAAHPRTCGDGVSIVFGELEIQVLIFDAKASTPLASQPAQLFKLARGLERLDQVERIAQEDIAARLLAGETVDQAEVRLGYRVGLANTLDLPGQPQSMLFDSLSGVNPGKLSAALQRIRDRERTAAFTQSLIQREFWMEYLEEHYAERFDPVKAPFTDRIVDLDSREDQQATDQQYLDEVASISQARRDAVEGLAIRLTEAIADQVSEAEGVDAEATVSEQQDV